ncbi:MAG: ribosome biogenesis GTPase Der [Pseudomonadota bacterium]
MSKLTIALVGRPNVGKSTLFNRLSIRKKAIVHDKPGVTRDRKYAEAQIGPLDFVVVDTPGLEEAKEGAIEYGMTEQTISAVKIADVVCLVVDGFVGVTPQDIFFANLIRKTNNNCILLVNKCERNVDIDGSYFKLGFGAPIQISAEHGLGMADLCEKLLVFEKEKAGTSEPKDPFKTDRVQIAIVGRPNSGKSTFINALLSEDRVLTGPEAGITRDSIEIEWKHKDKPVILVDTAGLRKRGNVVDSLEKLSASDTIHSIKYANTVVLMLDSTRPLEQQDLNIASFIINEGRALVLAINKWDLVSNKKAFKKDLEEKLALDLPQVIGLPCVYLSASRSENILDVIDECFSIYEIWNKRLPTAKLNDWLRFATEYHTLPLQKNGRRLRIKYCTQIKTRPPTFKFFCNKADDIPDSYRRYLLNDLRKAFDMPGVPMRIDFVSGTNPYG